MTRDHTYVITKVILHARGFGIARAIARAVLLILHGFAKVLKVILIHGVRLNLLTDYGRKFEVEYRVLMDYLLMKMIEPYESSSL